MYKGLVGRFNTLVIGITLPPQTMAENVIIHSKQTCLAFFQEANGIKSYPGSIQKVDPKARHVDVKLYPYTRDGSTLTLYENKRNQTYTIPFECISLLDPSLEIRIRPGKRSRKLRPYSSPLPGEGRCNTRPPKLRKSPYEVPLTPPKGPSVRDFVDREALELFESFVKSLS